MLNPEAFNLTLEQQLELRLLTDQVAILIERGRAAQLGDLLIKVSQQIMIKDNVIKDLLDQQGKLVLVHFTI
jgi:hypothetical protein